MCRAVLQLGSSLGLPVIVEGVTNPAVFQLLRDMGHRYLQGYVFSRPLEAEQLADGAWEAWVELPDSVPVQIAEAPAQSAVMPS
jgi:EAL domain-containing protein (putative c-di-GMP-specific phosphodiesterase class I)